MILIDIKVMAFDKTYDFNVDENSNISVVIEEVGEMLTQMEQCGAVKNYSGMQLFTTKGKLLKHGKTLAMYGIRDGSTLIMI